MTREEAMRFYRDEIKFLHAAPRINGCEMKDYWKQQIEIHTMALEALSKQEELEDRLNENIGAVKMWRSRYYELQELVAKRNQQGDCKWMQDEFCVNPDCPMRADFCPVVDYPGVCRFEDRRPEGGAECSADG